tara:strand:- start:373 stop:618 length:246 start_codon:yes stop_codon:yes gene_type:complete
VKPGIYKLSICDYKRLVRTGGLQMILRFVPIRVFRETPQVSFFDASVDGSNCADVVIHHKNAVSPPTDGNFEQYYIHHHQS